MIQKLGSSQKNANNADYKKVVDDNAMLNKLSKEDKENMLSHDNPNFSGIGKFPTKLPMSGDDKSSLIDAYIEEINRENVVQTPESSNQKRIAFRFILGLLPAIGATFLNQQIINYITTAAGFLAPPFVIIFPALLSINFQKNGKVHMSKLKLAFTWFVLIFFGFGSYVAVVINLAIGGKGG